MEAMIRCALLAAIIFPTVICGSSFCYAANVPLGCAAPSSQSNDEVISFLVTGSTNTPSYCYTVTRSGIVIKETGASRFQNRPGQLEPFDRTRKRLNWSHGKNLWRRRGFQTSFRVAKNALRQECVVWHFLICFLQRGKEPRFMRIRQRED